MTPKSAVALCLGLISAMSPLGAHHGSSWFDKTNPMALTGVVSQVDWTNPHAYIYLDVKSANRDTQNWAVECFPMNRLTRDGQEYIPRGTTLSIIAFQPLPGQELAISIQSELAKQHLKSNRYVAGGCATIGSTHRQLGYGPACS